MKSKSNGLIQIALLTLLMFGCSEDKQNKIELNSTLNKKLEINSTCQIVQLETTSESLLKYISKAQIDKSSDRIFVLASHNIYIYNLKGKYISKLKIGRGPGEIRRATSFTLDLKSKRIFLIDDSRKICSFDYHGNMIKSYNTEDFSSKDICLLDNDNVLLASNYVIGGKGKYFVGLYNLTSEEIVKEFISSEKSDRPRFAVTTYENFSTYNGKIYYTNSNIFGLFEYNDSDFDHILSFEITKNALPKSFIQKNMRPCDLREKAKKHHYAAYMLYGFLFKGYYFIGIDDDDLNCYVINRETKEVYRNGALPSYFGLPNKESFKYLRGVQEDLLLFQCVPSDFFGKKSKITTKEIYIGNHTVEVNINDNPFIVIVE